ncbi:hypothetical protein [Rhodoferax sp.]|uniref:hypothetical protein n=1 Tax=Rhodoferax sp. TaxID=50421 RepID=UPI002ACEF5B7|nr:hypothetical protein [Rhodoferax sp.]MDZ7920731.1 hypothetical protein [Rhodoferax sp.]
MSRKPIEQEIKGLQTPRERVWNAMLKLSRPPHDGSFDKTMVQDYCSPMVSWTLVDDYFDALEAAGHLVRVGGKSPIKGQMSEPIRFKLVQPRGEAPRVGRTGAKVTQGGGNEAMWRAMKVLSVFDYKDIAGAATLGSMVVKPETAKSYVLQLARAGYLTQIKASKPGVPGRYRLTRNTGMHAPAITRKKVVFDRNTGSFADLETAQEVCDALE